MGRSLTPAAVAWATLVATLSIGGSAAHADDPRATRSSPPSFRYEVLPILARHGCSAGACHGSPTGKGGFRLSLRGFDPTFDRLTLVREDGGRRANPLNAESSLLLAKPLLEVSHAGGRRWRRSDEGFAIVRDWIAAGCRDDAADSPTCIRLVVEPNRVDIPWPGDRASFRVRAVFSDGSSRDVTTLVSLSSSHPAIAQPQSEGRVAVVVATQRGEATIMVRYLEHVATVDAQFAPSPEGFQWQAPRERNEIDRLAFAKLRKLQIQPSSACADHEFLRRVTLDLLGVLPTPDEAREFLASQEPGKREAVVQRLLRRPEYAEYWAQKWADVLRVRGSRLSLAGVHKFHRWLVRAVDEDLPYDQFVTALIAAQGSTLENPPASFYRAMSDPTECGEAFAQLFLGVRIQCAKCHNHPGDRWSQDDYYGLAAFFARVQRKRGARPGDLLVWLDRTTEQIHPRGQRPQPPRIPAFGAEAPSPTPAMDDRRRGLTTWFSDPANRQPARVAVNRLWNQLFGRGLVEPVDDFRADNPASHPDVLEHLTQRFLDGHMRQRDLLRYLLASEIYQLSSRTNSSNERDERYFSHAYARMLAAEPLANAIAQATGAANQFVGLPEGTRATNLPSPDYSLDFFADFGQPARSTVCQCERANDPKLAQALQLVNGPYLSGKLRDRRSIVSTALDDLPARLAAAGEPPRDGLVAWFRADQGVTGAGGEAIADGRPVAEWRSLIGSNLPATQLSDAQRPAWQAHGLGGLPSLVFDGRDDFLRHEAAQLVAPGAPRTLVIVGRKTGDKGGALFTFGRSRTGGGSVFTAQHIEIGGQYYVYSDGVNAAGNATGPPGRLKELVQPFLTTFLSRGAGEKLRVGVNGTWWDIGQPGGVGVDQRSPGFTIGSREDLPLGEQLWPGELSEILVYDRALDDEPLRRVGTYLTTRFALETSYPRASIPESPGATNQQIITQLYWAALSRPPSAAELAAAERYVAAESDRRESLDDLAWSLLNSKEFLFQH